MKSNRTTSIAIDQYPVRTDGALVCFNDLYVAAKSPSDKKKPNEWMRNSEAASYALVAAQKAIDFNEEFNYAAAAQLKSRPESSSSNKRLLERWAAESFNLLEQWGLMKRREGRGGGTYGHKLIAMEYSGYLSDELKLKVNEIFLRFQEKDITLAAEIADESTHQDQAWLGTRMQGKVSRNTLTDVLQNHSVVKSGFGECTNAIYKPILGGTALEVRQKNGWPNKVNIRDRLALKQLFAVGLAECTAAEKIEENQVFGNKPCAALCFETSQRVAAAIA